MSSVTTLKRRELYDLVWQQPITRLAKAYGLSDVGLAKVCRSHDIPCPPRGYWARKQHGQQPEQIPLPRPEQNGEITVRESDPPPPPEHAEEKVAEEQRAEMQIRVGDSLRGAHPLVSRANEELHGLAVAANGLIPRAEKQALRIVTSRSSLRRALLIMDALLKALEQRGYAVGAGPSVKILDSTLHFGIEEQLETKREHQDEVDLDAPYSFGHSRYNDKRVPSGRLTLSIDEGGHYWCSGCRRRWHDTDKRKLEDQLNKFVVGLVQLAAREQHHEEEERQRLERERKEEQRRQEAARQLAEKRKQYKAEKARVAELLLQANNMRKSQEVRTLIEAVRAKHGPIDPASEIAQWVEWATRQADRLDPLKESPPSILDEDLEEEEPSRPGYRPGW